MANWLAIAGRALVPADAFLTSERRELADCYGAVEWLVTVAVHGVDATTGDHLADPARIVVFRGTYAPIPRTALV